MRPIFDARTLRRISANGESGMSGMEKSGPSAIGKSDSVSGRRLTLRPLSKMIEFGKGRFEWARLADPGSQIPNADVYSVNLPL